ALLSSPHPQTTRTWVSAGPRPPLPPTSGASVTGDPPPSFPSPPPLPPPATASSPVGGYGITASGAVDPNYTITYVNGTLTITPAALTITADNQSMVYGSALPALTASYSGFVNGDTAATLTTLPTLPPPPTPTCPPSPHPPPPPAVGR